MKTSITNDQGNEIASVENGVLSLRGTSIDLSAFEDLADLCSFYQMGRALSDCLLRTGQLMAAVINSEAIPDKCIAPDPQDMYLLHQLADGLKVLEPETVELLNE